MILRILRLLLGVPSPSWVAVARGQFPMRPRTWLERREFAFARRWLAAHPPPPELLEAERKRDEALRWWRS